MANHFSPRTTKLYDWRKEETSLDARRVRGYWGLKHGVGIIPCL
jgi:hypothetical protein